MVVLNKSQKGVLRDKVRDMVALISVTIFATVISLMKVLQTSSPEGKVTVTLDVVISQPLSEIALGGFEQQIALAWMVCMSGTLTRTLSASTCRIYGLVRKK